MIYEAIVLDNTTFLKNGTIRVRVAGFYMNKLPRDLSENPKQINDGVDIKAGTHCDFEAYVYSPLGGGQNFGSFFLPEVNSRGVIAFLGGAYAKGRKCFWLGSLFLPEFNGNTLKSLPFPSDSIDTENSGFQDGTKNISVLDGALIVRTKTVEAVKDNDTYKQKNLDWKQQETENLIVINKDKVKINHNNVVKTNTAATSEDYSKQEFTLSKEENSIRNITKTKGKMNNSSLVLSNGSNGTNFNLEVYDEKSKVRNTVSADKEALTISSTLDEKTAFIKIIASETDEISGKKTKNTITIETGGNSFTIDDKGITINAEENKVYVVAKEIHLGKTGQRVLTTISNKGTYSLPNDALTVEVSDSIFG